MRGVAGRIETKEVRGGAGRALGVAEATVWRSHEVDSVQSVSGVWALLNRAAGSSSQCSLIRIVSPMTLQAELCDGECPWAKHEPVKHAIGSWI